MEQILVGLTKKLSKKSLLLPMVNRHGLITGATGTGKTVTLQTIIEQLSQDGIPVFAADVKGDLSGIAMPGLDNPKLKEKRHQLKQDVTTPQGCPTRFWDLYGETGHPLRATVTELGPVLLGRLLNTNDTQAGILNSAFKYADDQGLLLLDLKDLQALLTWIADNSASLSKEYGNFSKTSIGALQRGLLTLDTAGGNKFFGEPALRLEHLLQIDSAGKGIINILDARKLIQDSRLYSTFLLWLLSELFEQLPEIGEVNKPKLVFFFDEAHLLFSSAPPYLLEKIEQVVRLIRSKGVGVYFITQNPLDVPETVLGQLGNRVQHALRAFTPKDQKAVRSAAQTFRQNPDLNTEQIITEMGVGEALVSFLDDAGVPTIVERVSVLPPISRVGTISDQERTKLVNTSSIYGTYEQTNDRESAFEILNKRTTARTIEVPTDSPAKSVPKNTGPSTAEVLLKTTARTLNSRVGQQIIRGILGSIFGSGKK